MSAIDAGLAGTPALSETDWRIRHLVYAAVAERGAAPALTEIAAAAAVSPADVQLAYERLDAHHAIFLDPATRALRMAHPFSLVETAFRVRSGGVEYRANCAWDSLGIPAALHRDAEIAATCAATGQPLALRVVGGRVEGDDPVAHFPLPFQRWYDDLITT